MAPALGILAAMLLISAPVAVLVGTLAVIVVAIGGARHAYREGASTALVFYVWLLATIAIVGALNFLSYKTRYVDPLPLTIYRSPPALPELWLSLGRFDSGGGLLDARGFKVVRYSASDRSEPGSPHVIEIEDTDYVAGSSQLDFFVVTYGGASQKFASCAVPSINSGWPFNLVNIGYRYANMRRHRRYGECIRAVYRSATPLRPFNFSD